MVVGFGLEFKGLRLALVWFWMCGFGEWGGGGVEM